MLLLARKLVHKSEREARGFRTLLSDMLRSRKTVSNRGLAIHRDETPSARGGRTTRSEIGDEVSSSLRLVSEDFHSGLAAAVSGKVECLRQEATGALGRNVSVEEAESLFFVNWAVEVAMSATVAEHRGSTESWWWLGHHQVTQMFFMRFCHSICGDGGNGRRLQVPGGAASRAGAGVSLSRRPSRELLVVMRRRRFAIENDFRFRFLPSS
ncbi:hypothetical protein MRX96_056381 [Rhipicephalus microplus]